MVRVKLKGKELKNGLTSLFLEYYPPIVDSKSGKMVRRENLKLYIQKGTRDPFEKQKNQIVMATAEKRRIDRETKLLTGAFEEGSFFAQNDSFLEFFKQECRKRASSDGNYNNWLSTYKYLEKFSGGSILFKEINEKFCERFKQFLMETKSIHNGTKKLSSNTKHSYFNKFKAAVRTAYEDNLLAKNFTSRIKSPVSENPFREFLSLDELKLLRATPCENPVLKIAGLFSALTGLRWSDIHELHWGNLLHSQEIGYYIRFMQKKTKGQETLPISTQAFELLGVRQENQSRVFPGLKYSSYTNIIIDRWVRDAGIQKKITFHCFRHSYATLLLTMGIDIYTVSKMLGHRQVKTTEIYGKIINAKKVEAANKITI